MRQRLHPSRVDADDGSRRGDIVANISLDLVPSVCWWRWREERAGSDRVTPLPLSLWLWPPPTCHSNRGVRSRWLAKRVSWPWVCPFDRPVRSPCEDRNNGWPYRCDGLTEVLRFRARNLSLAWNLSRANISSSFDSARVDRNLWSLMSLSLLRADDSPNTENIDAMLWMILNPVH